MYEVRSFFNEVCYSGSLYEAADWLNGTSFKFDEIGDDGKPIIKIRELKQGISKNTDFYIGDAKKEYELKKGDLLYTWSGSPDTSLDSYFFELDYGILNQHIFKVTPKKFVLKKYFYYLLNYLKPILVRIATDKQTTGLGHVTIQDLKELKIQIPKKEYQEFVINTLEPLRNKLLVNQKINNLLDTAANTLFKFYFQKSTDKKQSNKESYLCLGDHIDIIKGKSYKGSELKPSATALVTLKSFHRNGGYREDGLKEYVGSYKKDQQVKEGDLIVALTDVTQSADVIGKPAIIIENSHFSNLIISLDVAKIEIKKNSNLSKSFIYYLMKSDRYSHNSLGFVNGTNVLHLNTDAIKDFKFFIPNKQNLEKFNYVSNQILNKISNNSKTNKILNELMQNLNKKLLSGELSKSIKIEGRS